MPNQRHIDGLVQERRNSSALAMELLLSCTNPLIRFNLTKYNELPLERNLKIINNTAMLRTINKTESTRSQM